MSLEQCQTRSQIRASDLPVVDPFEEGVESGCEESTESRTDP